jgi:hypothetical protein
MTRALGNAILKRCYDLCNQARRSGITTVEGFDSWMDEIEKDFNRRNKYVDEDHNEKIRTTCRKIFFLMLRKVPGFDKRESFSRELEKVKL